MLLIVSFKGAARGWAAGCAWQMRMMQIIIEASTHLSGRISCAALVDLLNLHRSEEDRSGARQHTHPSIKGTSSSSRLTTVSLSCALSSPARVTTQLHSTSTAVKGPKRPFMLVGPPKTHKRTN